MTLEELHRDVRRAAVVARFGVRLRVLDGEEDARRPRLVAVDVPGRSRLARQDLSCSSGPLRVVSAMGPLASEQATIWATRAEETIARSGRTSRRRSICEPPACRSATAIPRRVAPPTRVSARNQGHWPSATQRTARAHWLARDPELHLSRENAEAPDVRPSAVDASSSALSGRRLRASMYAVRSPARGSR